MSLKDLSTEKLEEMFENFLFNMDDNIESFIEKAEQQHLHLDYSIESLSDLQKYLELNQVDRDSDDVNDAAAYFGEVVRKNYGGTWKCSLDLKNNSINYGKPVISGHTSPPDLELNPFQSVLSFIIRPRENHFLRIVENHINPTPVDLDKFPTEKD